MKWAKRFTLAFAAPLLTGCGQHLGDYVVEDVRVVPDIPPSDEGSPSPSYGRYLEIRVASKASLTSIGQKVGAIYVKGDFCPLRDHNGLIAFGPYGDAKQDLSLPGDATALKAGEDGLYRYRLYVAIAFKAQRATESGQLQLPTYDLQLSNRDLCLRLFAPGYNLSKSQSDIIKVPTKVVVSALRKGSVPLAI